MQRFQTWSRLNLSGNPAPSCTVTVYNRGTNILSNIYLANNVAQPASNPFTAGVDGFALFYAANGRYDVQFSGGGIVNPYTLGDTLLYDPGTVGS